MSINEILTEILTALACDNMPRMEVDHDNATASINSAVESVQGICTDADHEQECSERDSRFGVCFACAEAYKPPWFDSGHCIKCEDALSEPSPF